MDLTVGTAQPTGNISAVGTLDNMKPITPNGTDKDALRLTHAILLAEHGGSVNYTKAGDGGTSFGGYQWHSSDGSGGLSHFASDAKAAGLDPNDTSPVNQDKVAYTKIKAMKDKGLQPAEIASTWNSGSPNNWQNHRKVDPATGKVIYDTPAYVQNVKKYYAQLAEQDKKEEELHPYSSGDIKLDTPDNSHPTTLTDLAKKIPGGTMNALRGLVTGTVKGVGNLENDTLGALVDKVFPAMKNNPGAITSGPSARASEKQQMTPHGTSEGVGNVTGKYVFPAVGAALPLLGLLGEALGVSIPEVAGGALKTGGRGLVRAGKFMTGGQGTTGNVIRALGVEQALQNIPHLPLVKHLIDTIKAQAQ